MGKIAKLVVNGMHCQGCANKIINGLGALNKGQAKTSVDLNSKIVRVEFEQDLSLSEIKSKITEVGFSIENVELE